MPARFHVLITDRAWSDLRVEREILEPIGAELIDAPSGEESVLMALARDADAIGTCWAEVTPTVINSSPDCRIIVRFGIGLDNISLSTADERGIPVVNVPDYCLSEVSDHALGLLLACERKIAFYDQQSKQGVHDLQAGPAMRRLSECTLGLAGLGRIARELLPKARALGLQIIAWNRTGSSHGLDCEMVDWHTLLRRSDFISVHVPLTDETRHLFNRESLSQMKPGSYLINTARAEIIDEDALLAAVGQGPLAGAGLDLLTTPDHPLSRHPRVIVTPHAAFLSVQSLRDLRVRAAEALRRGLLGEPLENVVNLKNQQT